MLYQKVEVAHNHLSSTFSIDDPLPLDVLLKSEEYPDYTKNNENSKEADSVNVFDSEFKVEVNELDNLPQLEIIEKKEVDSNTKRPQRKKRQIRQTDPIPKICIKRIKEEYNAETEKSDKPNSSVHDCQPKKRGRPRRKGKNENETNSVNEHFNEESVKKADTALQTETNTTIKAEAENNEEQVTSKTTVEDQYFEDEANDKDFNISENNSSSNVSSDNNSDSEVSDWFDEKKTTDKYAVIYRKSRVVPKKYKRHKKGEKPEVKHFTKAELAAMRAQQEEYDQIIKEFFKIIRCPKCEVLVKSYSDLRPHFRIDHNKEYGYLVCCGRQFTSRKYLVDHIMVHKNPEQFKCKTCDQICRDSKSLETHEQKHCTEAGPVAKETVQCEICLKTYTSKSGLKHHILTMHVPKEEYKYQCSECQKK